MSSTRLFTAALCVLAPLLAGVAFLLAREGGYLGAAPPPGSDADVVGIVTARSGTVQVKRIGRVDWEPLDSDGLLRRGDRLQTLDGRVVMRLGMTRTLTLGERTLIVIRAPREVQLHHGSADLASGSAGEGSFSLDSGDLHVRSGGRSVSFARALGALPEDPGGRWAAEMAYLQAGIDRAGLSESMRPRVDEIVRLLAMAEFERARSSMAAIGRELPTGGGGELISVERGDGTAGRVEVLKGDATVHAGMKSLALSEGSGLLVRDDRVPTDVRTLLPPPSDLEPAAGRTLFNQARPRLQWGTVDGAVGYRVEVASDAGFETLIATVQAAAAEALLDRDLPDGAYFWRVRARDADGFSGRISATVSFALHTDRQAPPLEIERMPAWD